MWKNILFVDLNCRRIDSLKIILLSPIGLISRIKMERLHLKNVIIGISIVLMAGSLLINDICSIIVHGQPISYKTAKNHTILSDKDASTIRVDDIDIAYKIFGNGDPLILISGYMGSMDSWNPLLMERLASNYTVVVFNNRGIGDTTSGDKSFSIRQFAIDTFGLLKALNINKAHVLGHSMGGMIALELALMHPERVSKLIISASLCGQNEFISTDREVGKIAANLSGTPQDRIERLVPFLFPKEWYEQNSIYRESILSTQKLSNDTLNQQVQAMFGWKGVCNQLKNISHPTLVIGGFDDVIVKFDHLLVLADNIPAARVIGFNGGGHGFMHQNPKEVSSILSSFLKE
jgi:pimeloyl-ACP methyl ester carboxylesterase